MEKENYKVCILTAGVNSANKYCDHINSGILPVNNKAVLSYIVERFPEETEIVIAVGHKKDTVINYLEMAYPERKFTFVEVDNFSGPGSGPGYSLLACKKYLDSPFVFFTSDTIIIEDIPELDKNWIGVAPVRDPEQYCTVKIKNNLVVQIDDKIKTNNKFAFIGLAGIKDHEAFFNALEQNKEIRNNELQMVDGFKGLLEHQLVPTGFTWFDTGSDCNYEDTNKHFSGGGEKYDFSKSDEFIYFVNNRIIKFFADEKIAQNRFDRSRGALKGVTPVIDSNKGGFYSYSMVPGQTMYNNLNIKVLKDFLTWAKDNLWQKKNLDEKEREEFKKACHDFYYEKTKKRLELFYLRTEIKDDPKFINGVETPSVEELFSKIDWDIITAGTPSNFHGDLQFDNVLMTQESSNKSEFLLLDWRQDFGGLLNFGDLYYDLAKLYGGMILSYPLIKDGMFDCTKSGDQIFYHFFTKNDLQDAREVYESFLVENGFDLNKIKIISAIIFINMSPLHHAPFNMLLHSLGRKMLSQLLN